MMSLFSFLRARQKRNTIRVYVTQLGPILARSYGKAEYYSPERVRHVIQENGYPSDETDYALVLYCTPEAFATERAAIGASGYWQLRSEIMAYDFRHGRDPSSGGFSSSESSADYDAFNGFNG